MLPRVILHNSISLDGRIEGFMPDIGLHYEIVARQPAEVYMAGSDTLLASAQEAPPEDESAFDLSGGQQQRLCLARSLALEPDVIALDNPTSGLDPLSTSVVEESLQELKQRYTIIFVPHSVQQAARVADRAAFLLDGELIETNEAGKLFSNPQDERTEDYITGRFG